MLRPSVTVVCDVMYCGKRCVLEQKLLATAYRIYIVYENSIDNEMNDLDLCLDVINRRLRSCQLSTIESHSRLNISETVRDEAWLQRSTNRNVEYGEFNGHVTDDVT